MIWSLVSQTSSQTAIIASRALRPKVRSLDRNTPFANCCVMVLPPCDAPSDHRLCHIARAIPRGSTPQWLWKRRSSIAMKACGTWAGSSAMVTGRSIAAPRRAIR